MNQYSLCLILVSALSCAYADLTPAEYKAILSMPPYRSFGGFPKPADVPDDLDNELQQIAARYNLNLQDLYQWLFMIQTDAPNMSDAEVISWISQLASGMHAELSSAYPPSSFMKYPMLPNFAPRMPMIHSMRLHRREPVEGLVEAIVDDTTSNLKAAYNNVVDFADRLAPQTSASLKNVVGSLVGSGSPSPSSDSPSLSKLGDKLESNMRYMMADN